MKIRFLFRKSQLFLLTLACAVSFEVKSQDPFADLEKKAKKMKIQTKTLGNKILIDEKYPGYQVEKKTPIQFVPFTAKDLKDKNGQPIDPNSEITLQNGKKVKANDQLNEMNRVEKKINNYGYTFRDRTPIIIKLVPDEKSTSQKTEKILGPPLSEQQLAAILKPELKVGSIVLRPMKYYTKDEQIMLKNYKFSVLPDGRSLSSVKINSRVLPPITRNKLMQDINKSWGDCWSWGDPTKFSVAVCGDLSLAGKIYSYNVNNPQTNPSSYLLTASGSVDGSVLGSAYNVLQAKGTFEVKSDYNQKSKIDLDLKIAGTNVFDFTKDFPSTFEYENNDLVYTIPSIEKEFDFDILIFTLTCKASVNGSAGVLYGGNFDKTYVGGYARPFANLDVTAEASAGVSVVVASAEAGVRGSLSVIDGHVDLYGSAGIWSANNDQLVIFANLGSNYDMTFLRGKLKLFGEACAFGLLCKKAEATIADYSGKQFKGNIFNWTKTWTVGNDTY